MESRGSGEILMLMTREREEEKGQVEGQEER